jgi:hypothetical protein
MQEVPYPNTNQTRGDKIANFRYFFFGLNPKFRHEILTARIKVSNLLNPRINTLQTEDNGEVRQIQTQNLRVATKVLIPMPLLLA